MYQYLILYATYSEDALYDIVCKLLYTKTFLTANIYLVHHFQLLQKTASACEHYNLTREKLTPASLS